MKWKKIFVFYDFAFIFPKIAIKKLKRKNSCITEDIYETWFFTCGETQIYPNLAVRLTSISSDKFYRWVNFI